LSAAELGVGGRWKMAVCRTSSHDAIQPCIDGHGAREIERTRVMVAGWMALMKLMSGVLLSRAEWERVIRRPEGETG